MLFRSQATLGIAHSMKEAEPGYLVRCYQRCTCILEERLVASPELSDETMRTLLNILKAELVDMQYPIPGKTLA